MRYLLFAGEFYYARGGANDFKMGGNDLQEMIAEGERVTDWQTLGYNSDDWWHVLDTHEGLIVAGSKFQAHGVNDFEEFPVKA